MPPQARSTVTVPSSGTSIGTSSASTKAGTFVNVTRRTLPPSQSARTFTRPAGASRTSSVTGSTIGTMPVSSATVTVQIVLEPDIIAYSVCSITMKPRSASGWPGGTIRLQQSPG